MINKIINILENNERIANILGFSIPSTFTIVTIIERIAPVLQCIGFGISALVGISVIWLNVSRNTREKKQFNILNNKNTRLKK